MVSTGDYESFSTEQHCTVLYLKSGKLLYQKLNILDLIASGSESNSHLVTLCQKFPKLH